MVSSATNSAPVDYSQLFSGVAPTDTTTTQDVETPVSPDVGTLPEVDYGEAFGGYADAAAQKSQQDIAAANARVVEVKPDGKISLTAETAFAGKDIANNNPKLKIEGDIFLRNIDALNKKFIFGPYLKGDIRTNLDYQKVLTNIKVTETEPDPFTGKTSFDEHEEKTSVLVFDKWSANADLGFKAIHELLPQGSNDKNAIQDSLQFSWAIPVSLAMEENAQDDAYPLPVGQKAENYYTNYWIGTRPMLGITLTTHVNKLPLTIGMENTVGLLWGAPWYTTNVDQSSSFRFEEENKLKFDWEFLPGLTWQIRNSFALVSYDWNKTDISEQVSTGLELNIMNKTFKIGFNPFIYRLECTVPSSGAVADAYNGKIQYAADLSVAFDISKDLSLNIGADYTYAGMNKAEENTAAAKPLKITVSLDLKL